MRFDIDNYIITTIGSKLDEADFQAKHDTTRYAHEDVFSFIRNQIRADNRNQKIQLKQNKRNLN